MGLHPAVPVLLRFRGRARRGGAQGPARGVQPLCFFQEFHSGSAGREHVQAMRARLDQARRGLALALQEAPAASRARHRPAPLGPRQLPHARRARIRGEMERLDADRQLRRPEGGSERRAARSSAMVQRQAGRGVVGQLVVLIRTWVVFLVAMAAAGSSVAQQAPAADLATPEGALRSYWSLLDWREQALRERGPVDPTEAAYHRQMMEITAGRTRQFYQSVRSVVEARRRTKLERKIVSNTQESPQRAVIVANIRNVTPVPKGAKPYAALVRQRKKGEDFKYVLALDATRWKVLEVWSLSMGPRLLYAPSAAEYPAFVPPQ